MSVVRTYLWKENAQWGSDLSEDGTLVGAISKLSALLESVPVEHREGVRFELDDDDYGGSSVYLKIWYDRPQTPEEIEAERAAEEHRAAARKEHQEKIEREALAALRVKYPDA